MFLPPGNSLNISRHTFTYEPVLTTECIPPHMYAHATSFRFDNLPKKKKKKYKTVRTKLHFIYIKKLPHMNSFFKLKF